MIKKNNQIDEGMIYLCTLMRFWDALLYNIHYKIVSLILFIVFLFLITFPMFRWFSGICNSFWNIKVMYNLFISICLFYPKLFSVYPLEESRRLDQEIWEQSSQWTCNIFERVALDYLDESDNLVCQTANVWYVVHRVAAGIDVCAAVIPLIPQSPWYLDNACPQFHCCTSRCSFILDRISVPRCGMLQNIMSIRLMVVRLYHHVGCRRCFTSRYFNLQLIYYVCLCTYVRLEQLSLNIETNEFITVIRDNDLHWDTCAKLNLSKINTRVRHASRYSRYFHAAPATVPITLIINLSSCSFQLISRNFA